MGRDNDERRVVRAKKKLLKYVERDKFRKVKKLIDEERERTGASDLVNAVLNKRKQRPLHVASDCGSCDTLAALLAVRSVDVLARDDKGRLPLHYAAKYCLSAKRFSRALVSDLVSPLIGPSDSALGVPDEKGQTCRYLLMKINERQESEDAAMVGPSSRSFRVEPREEPLSWNEKLMQSAEDDELDAMGLSSRMYNNVLDADASDETYDDWADRIFKEYWRSRRPTRPTTPRENPNTEHKSGWGNLGNLDEKKVKKPDTKKKKRAYEKFCERYLDSKEKLISERCLPFTARTTPDDVIDALLEGKEGEAELKGAVREELRRWHPDKFAQKYGARFAEGEKDTIMAVVTHVSQSLINYGRR